MSRFAGIDPVQSVVDTPGVRRRPPVKAVGPVNRLRLAGGLAAFVLVGAATVAAVNSLAGWAGQSALAFALGFLLIPILAAPIEWVVHRYVYHEPVLAPLRPIFTVHTAHHFAFYPTWRYVTAGPPRRLVIRSRAPDVRRTPLGNARVRSAHFIWYLGLGAIVIWLPAWLLTGDGWFLAGLMISSAVVSNLFIVVHDTIHRPRSHRIVEAQPWFAFLDRHHYIHHIDLGSNLNFLLPLGDLVFGTLRTRLDQQELAAHGTLAEAKSNVVGKGERATAELTST